MPLPVDSKAAICNMALLRAGIGKRVVAFDTDTSTEAGACRDLYDAARDEVLGRFRWPFAETQWQLSQLGSADWSSATAYVKGDTAKYTDGFVYLSLQAGNTNKQPDTSGTFWRRLTRDGWWYVYALPTDCVKPREVFSGARVPRDCETIPFKEVTDADLGRLLLTDDDTPDLRGTARIDNPVFYSAGFTQALAWRLSMDLAYSLKSDPALALANAKMFEQVVEQAISTDRGGEENAEQPDSSFISVRM